MITLMQGDSYPLFIELKQNQIKLEPNMVDDVEICVSDQLRKAYSEAGVGYDSEIQKWYIRPSQKETLAMAEGVHNVIARVKYRNQPQADVKGINVGKIKIIGTFSEEVL